MIEAVTGGGCSQAKPYDYAEPLNVTQPSEGSKEQVVHYRCFKYIYMYITCTSTQIPVLFRMMDFMNPLIDCFDFNVDKSFPMTALGFGDVIIPGFHLILDYCRSGIVEFTIFRSPGRL